MKEEIRQRIEQIRRGEVPQGYEKIKDGIFPADWHIQKMKQWIALAERPVTLEDDKKYRLITVRRGFGGVDLRGEYLGKDILVKNYFVVRQGDFVISKRQIAHGACGVVPESLDGAVVSNEYNVFVPKPGTNIEMFNLVMQLPHYTRLFYLMSDGVHIEKLLFKTQDWMKRKLAMPPFEEQQKIAAILTAQDKVIELKEKRLAEKQRQKKHLMQQLLTGKKRLLGFIKKWRAFDFDELFITISTREHQINKTEYETKGSYPVIDQGKQMIAAYSNNAEKVLRCPKDGIIVFGDHTREIKFVDFDFIAGADGTQLLSVKSKSAITKYLFYYLSNKEIHSDGYSRHFKYVKEFVYRLPSLEEQTAIEKVLSAADREIDLLRQDIEQEKQKKKALMQLLLTGIVRVKI